MSQPIHTITTVTTKNTPSLTMGIISIVLGVLGLLISWVPFIGALAIPIAGVGILLSVIGLILAAVKSAGWTMPLLGGIICGIAIAVAVSVTGAAAAVVSHAMVEANKPVAAQHGEQAVAKHDYIVSHLVVGDIDALYQDHLDKKVPGISFTIKNSGKRDLKKVKVVCYFLDGSGARISEETFFPVSDNVFDGSRAPLKAGYTWTQEAGRVFIAKSVPANWAEGVVDIQIEDIEFASAD